MKLADLSLLLKLDYSVSLSSALGIATPVKLLALGWLASYTEKMPRGALAVQSDLYFWCVGLGDWRQSG